MSFCGGRGEKKKEEVEVASLPHHFPSSNTVATQSGYLSNDVLKLLSSSECVCKRAVEAHKRAPISSEKSARIRFPYGKLFDGEACHNLIIGLRVENCESVSLSTFQFKSTIATDYPGGMRDSELPKQVISD